MPEANAQQASRGQIDENRNRFRREVKRNSALFFGLLVSSIVASTVPGILIQLEQPSEFIKIIGTILAVSGAVLTAIQAAVGPRLRWIAARNTWEKVEKLSNVYAAGSMSPKEAMDELNTILDEYEQEWQKTVKA